VRKGDPPRACARGACDDGGPAPDPGGPGGLRDSGGDGGEPVAGCPAVLLRSTVPRSRSGPDRSTSRSRTRCGSAGTAPVGPSRPPPSSDRPSFEEQIDAMAPEAQKRATIRVGRDYAFEDMARPLEDPERLLRVLTCLGDTLGQRARSRGRRPPHPSVGGPPRGRSPVELRRRADRSDGAGWPHSAEARAPRTRPSLVLPGRRRTSQPAAECSENATFTWSFTWREWKL
jgi:hypothetical protein